MFKGKGFLNPCFEREGNPETAFKKKIYLYSWKVLDHVLSAYKPSTAILVWVKLVMKRTKLIMPNKI